MHAGLEQGSTANQARANDRSALREHERCFYSKKRVDIDYLSELDLSDSFVT